MRRQLAIVIGRNFTARLGMIRAAGIAGYDVAVVQTSSMNSRSRKPIDYYSKYVNSGYYKASEPNSELLIDVLLKNFKNIVPKPILMPIDDYAASVIDLNIDILREYFLFQNIGMEQGKVTYFMDKGVQKEIARKAGLNVADGWTASWDNDHYDIPIEVEYPCFIKPERSFKGSGKDSQKRCNSRAELAQALSKIKGSEDYPILIEKYIEIEKEYAVLGFADSHNIVVPDLITSELYNHGVTGKGRIRSIDCIEGLSEKLQGLMSLIGFTGLFDIDLYESAGTVYFNELNLRFGASGYAVTHSGINLPKLFCNYITYNEYEIDDVRIEEQTFCSEKVMMLLLLNRVITKREYRKIIKEADFLLIQDEDDPRPGKVLKSQIERKYFLKYYYGKANSVKRSIKKLIKPTS